ncbi:MAG TPA: hypothetical protein VKA38_03740 [Draconibacterium sp.]|nr:hypothetical protein [Draconibacterium sp.]
MQIENLQFSNPTPKIGDEIFFSFNLNLKTKKKQKVRLEYIVHFVKSNGKTSPKVFQIKEVVLAQGIHAVQKKHTFANMSTRKHFAGQHKFQFVVNGEVKAEQTVTVN